MDKVVYHLAIDIGASGGRHMLGWLEDGKLNQKEIYRFDNGCVELDGSLTWDVDNIFREIINGLKECKSLNLIPSTVGIDTWGVDYALIDKFGDTIKPVYSYRDARSAGFVNTPVPFDQMYATTGTQFQPFNTVYQLLADKAAGRLESAVDILMIPEYLVYKLTGKKVREYTNASTSGLIDATARNWDYRLIKALGLKQELFSQAREPGFCVGNLLNQVSEEVGFDSQVVMVASHDTASAVNTVPEDALYISSGTWSLVGILSQPILSDSARESNYANEGAMFGRVRFLKNIMGLWVIQSVRKEDNNRFSYAELVTMAEKEAVFDWDIDLNLPRFLSPKSMTEEIYLECDHTNQPRPKSMGELAHLVFTGLAKCYKRAFEELENITGKQYDTVHIIGGGSNNNYLNRLTAKFSGKKVLAGPAEATAAGNLLAQIYASQIISGKDQDMQKIFHEIIKNSFDIKEISADV